MSGNHIIVESGSVIYVIGPREGHTWHDHKGMWEVCKIDNAVMWDSPEDEAIDRENARKIRDGLNSYASSQAEIERLRTALEFYRDGFQFQVNPRRAGLEWKPTEVLLDDCGNVARLALSGSEP